MEYGKSSCPDSPMRLEEFVRRPLEGAAKQVTFGPPTKWLRSRHSWHLALRCCNLVAAVLASAGPVSLNATSHALQQLICRTPMHLWLVRPCLLQPCCTPQALDHLLGIMQQYLTVDISPASCGPLLPFRCLGCTVQGPCGWARNVQCLSRSEGSGIAPV